MKRRAQRSGGPDALDAALRACRLVFVIIGIFSLVLNALMLALPLYMFQVYDRVLSTGRTETLTMLTVMAVGALLILGLMDALRSALLTRTGRWLNTQLAPIFLTSSVRARLQGDDAGAQPLRDLAVVQGFVGGSGLTFLFDMPTMPLFIAVIWLLSPLIGLLALAAAILIFSLTLLSDAATRGHLLDSNVSQIRANLQAESTIRNAEVVRAMGMLPAMIARWQEVNDQSLGASQKAAERSAFIIGFIKALRFIVQVGAMGIGAMLVIRGEFSAGAMIACSIMLGRALAPVEQAMSAWKVFVAARIAYARLKARLMMLPPEAERMSLPSPDGRLSVEHVSYVPPGRNRAILRQVAFYVEPGEVLAVVGASAAGKSTLCRLLVGLYPPSAGQIRLDGADLRHWDPDRLGRYVGYLPQDVELFSGTVRDNIARMAQADDDDVIAAAHLAQAHEMILRLPEGYDTQIGDARASLSGGQRQRIGLARAVFGNPRLIVLDEPNANLDQAGESALAGAVNELKNRGVVMVIVGHRPSTLAHADKILVLRDGAVEMWGPRDTILQELRKANLPRDASKPPQVAPAEDAPAALPNRIAAGATSE